MLEFRCSQRKLWNDIPNEIKHANSIVVKGIKLWNDIPNEIKLANSMHYFKSRTKKRILESPLT